jgi:hypothetical protein
MILTSCESPLGKTIEGQLASMLASRCIQYEGNVKRDVLSRVAKTQIVNSIGWTSHNG